MKSMRMFLATALLALVSAACSSSATTAAGTPAADVSTSKDALGDTPSSPADTTADTAKADAAADAIAPKDVAAADTGAPESLDDFINSRLDTVGTPGLAFCLIKGGKVALCKGYGLMDLDTSTAVTPDSVFGVGAVSQLVTAAAVMQQVDAGKLDLDKDIDTYLGFSVRNPAFADVPLTLRQLLTFTSSIQDPDNAAVYEALYPAGDPTETLAQFVEATFKVGGKRYDAKLNYTADKPGTAYMYSSFSIALAGYLVEKSAGQSFDAYTKAKIFTPLGMKNTAWRLKDVDLKNLALPYTVDASNNYQGYEPYGSVDYPDSGLHTSVADFARFVLAIIGKGSLGGVKILETASATELTKVQFPKVDDTQALVWYTAAWNGEDWMGDSGADSGYTSDVYFRPSDGVGIVVFGNGEWAGDDPTIAEIEDRLVLEADKL